MFFRILSRQQDKEGVANGGLRREANRSTVYTQLLVPTADRVISLSFCKHHCHRWWVSSIKRVSPFCWYRNRLCVGHSDITPVECWGTRHDYRYRCFPDRLAEKEGEGELQVCAQSLKQKMLHIHYLELLAAVQFFRKDKRNIHIHQVLHHVKSAI